MPLVTWQPACAQLDLAGRGAVACDAWAWRERLQRAIDGCHTTDDMNAASMAEYHGAENGTSFLSLVY